MRSSPNSSARKRAIDQRHRHRLALALAEGEAIAARETRRRAVAAGELVDHLAFGERNVAERNGKAEILDEQLDLDLAEADLADERMVAAVAALRRIGEAEQEALVAARQSSAAARRARRESVARSRVMSADRRVGLGRDLALDQVVARR